MWAKAANTAVYLKIRSVVSDVIETPFEIGRKSNSETIKLFGSPVMEFMIYEEHSHNCQRGSNSRREEASRHVYS